MTVYATETAVEPLGDEATGQWSGHVHPRWNIGANPNGGYLVSIALAALARVSAHPDPLSVTTHFLRPGTAGVDAEVVTEVVRSGRTITTARAALAQNGTTRLEVVAAFSDLSAAPDVDAPAMTPSIPAIPPPERCLERSGLEQGIELPILDRLDVRIHPDQARAGEAGEAVVSGWIRLADGAAPDTRSVVMFADAFPPSLFGALGAVGWVPTVELTVHVRRRPAPGWILGRFTTDDLNDGRMIEDGALWDETGALVARSRQLGLLLAR